MKVSIITSCYNREKTIRGAVESVQAQDYSYIKYIIVDGASKDQSAVSYPLSDLSIEWTKYPGDRLNIVIK